MLKIWVKILNIISLDFGRNVENLDQNLEHYKIFVQMKIKKSFQNYQIILGEKPQKMLKNKPRIIGAICKKIRGNIF